MNITGLRYYPCRCTRCRGRVTLRHHPDWYIRRHHAHCPRCRSDTLIVDQHRPSGAEARRVTCYCTGYPFPHRRGSLLCDHGQMGAEGFNYYTRDCEEHAERERALFDEWMATGQAGASEEARP